MKAESSSLTSNKNRSEFLSEQFWKVDLPAMPELVLQSYGMAQSIKRFIEEQGKGRQKVCLKSTNWFLFLGGRNFLQTCLV